jgi:hypothetical protein
MDNRVDELIHEVEEQLKWERFEKLWKDYGSYIVAAIVAVIVGVSVYVYWNHSQLKNQEELSEGYTASLQLLGKGQTKEALEKLKTLEGDVKGYGSLARFISASTLMENPETRPQAIAIYRDMINNRSVERNYRNLAIIFLVMAELDTGDPKELTKLMQETSIGTNMWPETTSELTALVAIKSGDMELAKSILQELKENKNASQGVRLRASALLQNLQQKQ